MEMSPIHHSERLMSSLSSFQFYSQAMRSNRKILLLDSPELWTEMWVHLLLPTLVVTEYPKWEDTNQGHRVQLMAPRGTAQNPVIFPFHCHYRIMLWWSGSLLVGCFSTCRHLFQIHCCVLLCFETLLWISSSHRISDTRAVLLYYYHFGKFGPDSKQEGWLVNFLQDCSHCQYLWNVSAKKLWPTAAFQVFLCVSFLSVNQLLGYFIWNISLSLFFRKSCYIKARSLSVSVCFSSLPLFILLPLSSHLGLCLKTKPDLFDTMHLFFLSLYRKDANYIQISHSDPFLS